MFENIVLIVIGFILLVKGADFLVSGASNIAKRLKVSEMMIGMTVVAMGTSLPELIVSVKSSFEAHADISIGNVIGSNLINMMLILGICAIVRNLPIKKEVRTFDTPFNLIITFALILVCNFGVQMAGISRIEGIVFLVIFAFYLLYMIVNARKNVKEEEKKENIKEKAKTKKVSAWLTLVHIIFGAIGLKFGADFVVDNASVIAQTLGLSEKIIGLTIVAIGTSLPELASSVTAVKKGETDLAIGNILGSNVFNILLILGTTAVISPISYNTSYNIDLMVLFFASILMLFFPYFGKKNTMTRREGFIYVLIYLLYLIILIIR